MKSYTDLPQSKKLAEILPNETSDMYYWCGESIRFGGCKAQDKDYDIPCWSLAALLDILPLEVSFNKQTDGVDTYYYIASCDGRYCDVYSHRHINVVDACYEIILKLKERNLI